MAQNSSESKDSSSIESSMSSQSQDNSSVAVANALSNADQVGVTMKQDSNPASDMISLDSTPNPPEKQNGASNARPEVIDLTRPIKTEGEPSSLTSAPMADTNTSGNHSLGSRDGLMSTPTIAEGIGFAGFGTNITGLEQQLGLTPRQQALAYKKANFLALTTLAKKGGPSAKEMIGVQQKLQEFLTSLISLAGQKGPELKVKVQHLVQNLVTGQISEEDFAARIEADLHSQHQPSLLPFLKNSVPSLKSRLQLQQAILKELLQRQAAEKLQEQQQQQQQKSLPAKQPPQPQAPPITSTTSTPLLSSSSSSVVSSSSAVVTGGTITVPSASSSLPLPLTVQGKAVATRLPNLSSTGGHVTLQVSTLQQQQQQQAKPGTVNSTAATANDPIIIPATSNTSAAIVVGPVGGAQLPAALQQQLTTALNSPAFQQQFFNQLPKNIRDQVAKLPLEQQKFVYAHHLRRLQHLKLQAQQNSSSPSGAGDSKTSAVATGGGSSGKSQGSSGVPMFPPNTAATVGASGVVASPQMVLEKQQELVKQQQGGTFVIGGGSGTAGGKTSTSFVIGGKSGGLSGVTASSAATNASLVGGKTQLQVLTGAGGKTSFVNMKLGVPSGSHSNSAGGAGSGGAGSGGASVGGGGQTSMQAAATAGSLPPSSLSTSPKKKERTKGSKLKDGNAGEDEEDEVVGMDILDEVGVNLQEETAQFLPRSVGETTRRLYKDEVFLNPAQLRQRVLAIVRRHGLNDVSDDFLVLLSHATQERMKGVVEKLTQISQHRLNVLKDNDKYVVSTETRSQLRVLETIDRVVSKRKQERENEQTLKAAKSRSKGTDPEKVAKLREEAKQIQQDKAAQLLNAAANQTALAAIGQRKRPLADGGSSDGSSSAASLFAPLTTTRAPKRHITSRDLIFYMEQERETRKSLTLYRTLLK